MPRQLGEETPEQGAVVDTGQRWTEAHHQPPGAGTVLLLTQLVGVGRATSSGDDPIQRAGDDSDGHGDPLDR